MKQPGVRCAGYLAKSEHVRAPIAVRTDVRGGVYFRARVVLEESELMGGGDIVVTALPVARRLSGAAIGELFILRVPSMSLGTPFSGSGGFSLIQDGGCKTDGAKISN